MTNGLIASEAVMMGLAPHIGRERAHDLVYDLCRKAIEQRMPLVDLLTADAEVSRHLDRAAITKLADPANYVGLSGEMVDRVLRAVDRTPNA
jgi:3-carboxy-cis,cis-muconate cycloisomerase